jgi:hypothetical protein
VRLVAATAALVWIVVFAPSPALATPREDLREARRSFQAGEYKETIVLLTQHLYPTKRFSRETDIIEAHVLGQRERAAQEFEEALFLDADLTLDPLFHSEEVIDFFNAKKEKIQSELDQAENRRQLAEQNQQLITALKNARLVEKRPYFVNFIPFGAGQFQNKQAQKGSFFLISEVVLGGTSLTLWAAQLVEFGFPLQVPEADASRVRNMQLAQVTSGALFFGVAVWGIVDALVHWEPTKVTQIDLSNELLDRAPESSLRVLPAGGDGWAGASLSWEF